MCAAGAEINAGRSVRERALRDNATTRARGVARSLANTRTQTGTGEGRAAAVVVFPSGGRASSDHDGQRYGAPARADHTERIIPAAAASWLPPPPHAARCLAVLLGWAPRNGSSIAERTMA